MKNKKVKYIGLGEYPSRSMIKKFREQASNIPDNEKKELYLYFGTSKKRKKIKLFKDEK